MNRLLLVVSLVLASLSQAQPRYVVRSLQPYATQTHWLSPAEGIFFGTFLNVQYTKDSGKTWRTSAVPGSSYQGRMLGSGLITDSLHWRIYGWRQSCGGSFYVTTTDGGLTWDQFDTACGTWQTPLKKIFHTREGSSIEQLDRWLGRAIDLDMYDTSRVLTIWDNKPYLTSRSYQKYQERSLAMPDSSRSRAVRSVDHNVWRLETDSGSYLSIDNAESWERLTSQPQLRDVRFVGKGVGFGTGTRGYFYSNDSGKSWKSIANRGFSGDERVWVFDSVTAYFWDYYHLIEVFGIDTASQQYLEYQPDWLGILLSNHDTSGTTGLQLKNQSEKGLRIDSIHIGGDGFSIRRGVDSLAPWSMDSVIVEWKPTVTKKATGWIKIFSQAWMKSDTIWIEARVEPLQLSTNLDEFKFGSQFIGDTARISLQVESKYNRAFSFDQGTSSSGQFHARLDSAASPVLTYLILDYIPTSVGRLDDTLFLSFSDGEAVVPIPVSGTGKAPKPIDYFKSYIGGKDDLGQFDHLHSTRHGSYVVEFKSDGTQLFRIRDIDDLKRIVADLSYASQLVSLASGMNQTLLVATKTASYQLSEFDRDDKLIRLDSFPHRVGDPEYFHELTRVVTTKTGEVWYGVNYQTNYPNGMWDHGRNLAFGLSPDMQTTYSIGFNEYCGYPQNLMQRRDQILDIAPLSTGDLVWNIVTCDTNWQLLLTDANGEEKIGLSSTALGPTASRVQIDKADNIFTTFQSVERRRSDGAYFRFEPEKGHWYEMIEPDDQGGFFYVGGSSLKDHEITLGRVNAEGIALWKYVYSDPDLSFTLGSFQKHEELLYLVGYSSRVAAMAVDTNGQLVWSHRYDAGKGAQVRYTASTVDSAGNLWVAGSYQSEGGERPWLVKFGNNSLPVSVSRSRVTEHFRVYPNPAIEKIAVGEKWTDASYTITDVTGSIRATGRINELGTLSVNLVSGAYYLELTRAGVTGRAFFIVSR